MKKLPLDFDYSLFMSGNYQVASRGGAPVVIAGAITDEKGDNVILGKCNKLICQWSSEGRFYGTSNNPQMDLVLYSKPKTMYIHVVRSKSGVITSRVTDYKNTYTQTGNKLIAQFELEVENEETLPQF
jgi:hypothetical protein